MQVEAQDREAEDEPRRQAAMLEAQTEASQRMKHLMKGVTSPLLALQALGIPIVGAVAPHSTPTTAQVHLLDLPHDGCVWTPDSATGIAALAQRMALAAQSVPLAVILWDL